MNRWADSTKAEGRDPSRGDTLFNHPFLQSVGMFLGGNFSISNLVQIIIPFNRVLMFARVQTRSLLLPEEACGRRRHAAIPYRF